MLLSTRGTRRYNETFTIKSYPRSLGVAVFLNNGILMLLTCGPGRDYVKLYLYTLNYYHYDILSALLHM